MHLVTPSVYKKLSSRLVEDGEVNDEDVSPLFKQRSNRILKNRKIKNLLKWYLLRQELLKYGQYKRNRRESDEKKKAIDKTNNTDPYTQFLEHSKYKNNPDLTLIQNVPEQNDDSIEILDKYLNELERNDVEPLDEAGRIVYSLSNIFPEGIPQEVLTQQLKRKSLVAPATPAKEGRKRKSTVERSPFDSKRQRDSSTMFTPTGAFTSDMIDELAQTLEKNTLSPHDKVNKILENKNLFSTDYEPQNVVQNIAPPKNSKPKKASQPAPQQTLVRTRSQIRQAATKIPQQGSGSMFSNWQSIK